MPVQLRHRPFTSEDWFRRDWRVVPSPQRRQRELEQQRVQRRKKPPTLAFAHESAIGTPHHSQRT